MPRVWDLFLARLNVRKGWIGAGFVRLGQDLGVGKMLVGGLTCEFWAENSKKKQKQKQSRRPSAFAPALRRCSGRALAPWARGNLQYG
jgi:hypothetical protein